MMRALGLLLCVLLAGCDVLGGFFDSNFGASSVTQTPPDVQVVLGNLETVELADQRVRRWAGRPTSGTQATFNDYNIGFLTGCPASGHDQTDAALNLLQFYKALNKWVYLGSIPTTSSGGSGTPGRVCVAITGDDHFSTANFNAGLQATPGLAIWYRHIWDVPSQPFPTGGGTTTRQAYLGRPSMAAFTGGGNNIWLAVAGRLENDNASIPYHEAFVARSMIVGFPLYSMLHQDLGTPAPWALQPQTISALYPNSEPYAEQTTYNGSTTAFTQMAANRDLLVAAPSEHAASLPSEAYFISANGDLAIPEEMQHLGSTPIPAYSSILKSWKVTYFAGSPPIILTLVDQFANGAIAGKQWNAVNLTRADALLPYVGRRRRWKSVNIASASRGGTGENIIGFGATVKPEVNHGQVSAAITGGAGISLGYYTIASPAWALTFLEGMANQVGVNDPYYLANFMLPAVRVDSSDNIPVVAYRTGPTYAGNGTSLAQPTLDSVIVGWRHFGVEQSVRQFWISFGSRRLLQGSRDKWTNVPSLARDPNTANNFFTAAATAERTQINSQNMDYWGSVLDQFSAAEYPN